MKYTPGTFENLFAAASPWNSRPQGLLLGAQGLVRRTPEGWFPAPEGGAYSTGVFRAEEDDAEQDILPIAGQPGVQWGNAEATFPKITIPRWPKVVTLPGGTDGHCEIVDEIAKVIHSFWMLRQDGAAWRAMLYNWSPLGGRGWGDPSHYVHGARASAVPPSGGLIRKHEVGDGDLVYRHALAISLPLQSLAASPPYVFPATNQDWDYTTNQGTIPYGTRLFLPATYAPFSHPIYGDNTKNVELMKFIRTLQVFGAYAVDRNIGTPFAVYVENEAGLSLNTPGFTGGWDQLVMGELMTIADSLCPMLSAESWLDGDERPMAGLPQDFNLISLRGGWDNVARWDDWAQSVILPPVTRPLEFTCTSSAAIRRVTWAGPDFLSEYKFTARCEGDATLRAEVLAADGSLACDSPRLRNGESHPLTFPEGCVLRFTAWRGYGQHVLRVSADLRADRRQVIRRSDLERRIG